ncbi:MAG: hypothetical protein ACFCU6_16280 [Balneolaceae bacterium]
MGLFDGPKSSNIKNWVCVMERGTEYEIELARSYLANLKIPSNILSKRDRAYSLNIGETSMVYLYVPIDFEYKARKALKALEDDLYDEDPDNDDNKDRTK